MSRKNVIVIEETVVNYPSLVAQPACLTAIQMFM
jgi:hypothetical protein